MLRFRFLARAILGLSALLFAGAVLWGAAPAGARLPAEGAGQRVADPAHPNPPSPPQKADPGQYHASPQDVTIPGSPISVIVRDSGSYAVYRFNIQQFYGTWAEGPYLWVNGVVWGPEQVPAGRAVNQYTRISNTLTGTGTSGDPWRVTTVLQVGTTGLQLTQQVSYVNGDDYIRNDWALCNTGSTPYQNVHLFHAADLYTQGSDFGYGYYDPATGSVGGYDQGHTIYQIFIPITTANHYEEDFYGTIWSAIGDTTAPGTGFLDTYRPLDYIDNGAGLEWIANLAVGACVNISDFISFSNQIVIPTATNPPTNTPLATSTDTPTATNTPAPPTATNTPAPSCVVQTPTRVATPAFTPAPGCTDIPHSGDLRAVITDHPNTTDAVFTNRSSTCSYRIGLAIYKRVDNNIDHQVLYDYQLAVIPPNSTLTLTVNNPPCAYQADAFYGDLIESFAGGVRYGVRRLDDTSGHGNNYCQPTTCPTPPPATATVAPPPPSATETEDTPTATPTGISACNIQFTDVAATDPFYPYIRCLTCRQILSGYADSTFRPGAPVTRGQAAKLLANAAGLRADIPAGRQTFADVSATQPFWLYIERAAAAGILSGYSDGTFRPDAAVTRSQLAKLAAQAAGYREPIAPSQQTFADVPTGSPFWVYVERMAGRGVLSGYADGTFRPGAAVTRAQSAKILANTFFPNCARLATPR